MDIFIVDLPTKVRKTLVGMPSYIIDKLESWIKAIRRDGLKQVQKTPGYHDEPLKGKRFGQRSVRLNKAYRAIYVIKKGQEIEFVAVEEVNRHDY